MRGFSRIGRAMNYAMDEFEKNGRSDAPKMMIVLTNGQSDDSVIEAAIKAR